MPSFGDELGRLIPHMRRFARALVRGHSIQASDDLVQETIVLAMRAERLAHNNLRLWCFSTLMRMHRASERTQASRDLASGNEASLRVARSSAFAGSASAKGPVAFLPREIARLDMLPLESREVLLLVTLVGMSYSQIAETLLVSVETVMSRLDHARCILAKGARLPGQGFGVAAAVQKPHRAAQHLHVVK